MPHNISYISGNLTVLDSLRGGLRQNNAQEIGVFPGFTRGLDFNFVVLIMLYLISKYCSGLSVRALLQVRAHPRLLLQLLNSSLDPLQDSPDRAARPVPRLFLPGCRGIIWRRFWPFTITMLTRRMN